MEKIEFRNLRRQKFLSEIYFNLNEKFIARGIESSRKAIINLRSQGSLEPTGQYGIFEEALNPSSYTQLAESPTARSACRVLAAT